MSKHNVILEITNGIWMIDESYANSQFLVIDNILKGKAGILNKDNAVAKFFSVDTQGVTTQSEKGNKPFNNAQPLSTAVIFVSGPIMKYDNCGAPGTKTYTELVKSARTNPKIGSIVIVEDTPGGTVAGTEEFKNEVFLARQEKPVISVVDGLLCSAGYWFASQSTEIYVSNKTDSVGSIGTMMSFADMQAYYEKQGVKFHEVYATQSTDKNRDFNDARKGNYDAIKARLDSINTIFLNDVIAGRGEKLNQETTLTGKVFMGQDAIDVGLVDGFKSLDEAIARAQELAQSTTNNNQNQPQTMKLGAKWTSMVAFLSAAFTGFKADETDLTEEHLEKINSELATHATVVTELQAAKAEKDSLVAEKATLASEKTTLQTAHDALVASDSAKDAEIQRLCGLNPGATSAFKKKTDDVGGQNEESDFSSEADDDLKNLRAKLYPTK
jgi:signal peptide peptidase SppA